MTDRELLDLAARALGGKYMQNVRSILINGRVLKWNPLQDDGDALRLVVKLNIEFACFDDMDQVNAGVWTPGPESWDCMTPYNGDKQAAVRRAITRAAAEIGKAMP